MRPTRLSFLLLLLSLLSAAFCSATIPAAEGWSVPFAATVISRIIKSDVTRLIVKHEPTDVVLVVDGGLSRSARAGLMLGFLEFSALLNDNDRLGIILLDGADTFVYPMNDGILRPGRPSDVVPALLERELGRDGDTTHFPNLDQAMFSADEAFAQLNVLSNPTVFTIATGHPIYLGAELPGRVASIALNGQAQHVLETLHGPTDTLPTRIYGPALVGLPLAMGAELSTILDDSVAHPVILTTTIIAMFIISSIPVVLSWTFVISALLVGAGGFVVAIVAGGVLAVTLSRAERVHKLKKYEGLTEPKKSPRTVGSHFVV